MEFYLLICVLLLCGPSDASQDPLTPDNCLSRSDVTRNADITDAMKATPAMHYALDTARNRAIFYTIMYRWNAYEMNWGRPTPPQDMLEYRRQPGLNYIYMSTTASVHAAPPGVVTAGLYFDTNSSYPNWLRDVSFNQTVPLFGVRADEDKIRDLGSTPDTNYTNPAVYPQNEFYKELSRSNDGAPQMLVMNDLGSDIPQTVQAYQNTIDEETGDFTKQFYDCGQENRWMVNAVSMATEPMARSSIWLGNRHNRSVAVSTVGVLTDAMYPGYHGNQVVVPPSASHIRAGQAELEKQNSNRCSNLVSPDPPVPLDATYWTTERLALTLEVPGRSALRISHFLSNFLQNNDRTDNERHAALMNEVFMEAYRTWDHNDLPPRLEFDDPMIEVLVDQPLTRRQLVTEVYAAVMATSGVSGVGIYLDTGVFPNSTRPVSAMAWRRENHWHSADHVGSVTDVYAEGDDFTQEAWFLQAKQQFTSVSNTNTATYSTRRTVRTSRTGAPKETPEPVTYTATTYDQGTWLPPVFLCGPRQAGWVSSYVSPILVKETDGTITFGGVVKIDATFTVKNIS